MLRASLGLLSKTSSILAAAVLVQCMAIGGCSEREEPRVEAPASPASAPTTATTPAPATTSTPTQATEGSSSSTPASASTIEITDDMKRVVKVPTSATRIAVLAPFAADLLLDLGVKPIVVPAIRGGGPASWKDLPTVAVDHSAGPNLEQIVASKPDLIIATTVYAQFMQQIEASSKAPVIVLDVKTLDDVARHLKTLGSITGKDAAAAELIGGIERAVTEQAAANQGAASSKVLAIFGTPHAFYGFLPDSYLGDLVRRCNASLVTEGLTSHKVFQGLAPLSMEAIVAKNPEVILVVYHGPSEVATAMLAKDPAWNGLDAVVKKRVHVLNDELFVMHTGLRPAEALSQIANAIKAPAAEPSTP